MDTSIWIDFLTGTASPHRRALHRLIEEEEEISITGIILTEILQGIKSDHDFNMLREYLLEFPLYSPQGTETYLHAAWIYRRCRSHGKTVRKTIDCVIAAICIESNLLLFHKDKDFDIINKYTSLRCYRE